MHECASVYMCVRVCFHEHTRSRLGREYTNKMVFVYVLLYIQTCACTYTYVYVCVCVRECAWCAYVHMCACVNVCVCMLLALEAMKACMMYVQSECMHSVAVHQVHA